MQIRSCRRWVLGVVAGFVVASLGVAAWRDLYPVTVATGWSLHIFRDAIPRVSALATNGAGALFVSEELLDRHGRILRLSLAEDIAQEQWLSGLSKPDGLAFFQGGVAISQEQGSQPVLWRAEGEAQPLFVTDNAEGVATDGHALFVIEDRHGGRILRYDPVGKEVTVLRSGLDEPEGIAVCPDGGLYYSEKGQGRVYRWQPDGLDQMVLDGLKAPGFLMCNKDGLWITEDATHMARLLLLDSLGRLKTVLNHLRSPQTILELGTGRYLLAEQGRDRILELEYDTASAL